MRRAEQLMTVPTVKFFVFNRDTNKPRDGEENVLLLGNLLIEKKKSTFQGLAKC